MVDNTVVESDFGTVMTDEQLQEALKAPETPKQEDTPKPEDNHEDNPLATEEQTAPVEDEDTEEVEIPVDEQEESKSLRLKPKKQSARERVEEAIAKMRQAERERDEAIRRAQELEARPKTEKEEQTAPVQKQATGPLPDDVDANGELKYPLGEYDPLYIRDYTKHVLDTEMAARKQQEEMEAAQRAQQEAVEAITRNWQERLAAVQETLPDIQEKGMRLESAFEGLNPDYGQYLAQTIMSLENGPEVLYYLSDNIDKARELVAAGPLKATLGLGELNSMFKSKKAEPPVKVTSAPEPPTDRARGTNGRFEVPDDTDDLEAFAKKFYGR